MTKIELTQDNNRLATENADLRARVHQLEGDLLRVTDVASAINTMRPAHPRSSRVALFVGNTQRVSYLSYQAAAEAARNIKVARPDVPVAIRCI
jgi:hypothetical protein